MTITTFIDKHKVNPVTVNPVTAAIARRVGRRTCRDTESFIFVANTGRCGSASVAEIFGTLPNAVSLHEPDPVIAGTAFIEYNDGNASNRDRIFSQRKVPKIYWNARSSKLYFESNHLFIKCFADLAVKEFGPKLKVIYLHREKLEVASSLYNRHSANAKDIDELKNWVLSPFASENLLKIDDVLTEDAKFGSTFFHLLWYCYEIEARTTAFAKKYPDVPIVELRTQDLNSFDKVSDLLTSFGVSTPESLHEKIGVRANTNPKASTLPDGISTVDVTKFESICEDRLKRLGLEWSPNSTG